MNYTNLTLLGLGVLGILLHNLVELNKLNKAKNGNLKIAEYLSVEYFSIIISLIVVFCCVIIKHEITQLEQAGKWIGLAFISIGYMGQSLLIFVMGKAHKTIDKSNEDSTNNNNGDTPT